MDTQKIDVSIGLPVYNGDKFLGETIDSLLAQTFSDFELIISDNASTDKTESICLNYQRKDSRIKYSRNRENLGAARNYNRVFSLASGKYFKWAAHDDLCHPGFLEACVNALDRDPNAALAYTAWNRIDENGNEIRAWTSGDSHLSSSDPYKRFQAVIDRESCIPIFGLIRASILARTPLLGSFPMHDYVLLGELALQGTFYEIPTPLFSLRVHPSRFSRAVWNPHRPAQSISWFDTRKSNLISFPYWRRSYEHLAAVSRPSLPASQKLRCFIFVIIWMLKRNRELTKDLAFVLVLMLGRQSKV